MFGRSDTKDEYDIELGEEYEDTVTGFVGKAVARHEYMHGCTRVSLQRLDPTTGDIKEFSFDAPALRATKVPEQEITSARTGGPERHMPGARGTGR